MARSHLIDSTMSFSFLSHFAEFVQPRNLVFLAISSAAVLMQQMVDSRELLALLEQVGGQAHPRQIAFLQSRVHQVSQAGRK